MTNFAGRKFKLIKMMDEGNEDDFYGAEIGDIITLSGHNEQNWPGAIWATQKENPGVFKSEFWKEYENLCIVNNQDELYIFFEEVL